MCPEEPDHECCCRTCEFNNCMCRRCIAHTMWIADVDGVWETVQNESVRGTELALALLTRMQELLGDGTYWCADALATTSTGQNCDPLSNMAFRFSLVGAGVRARWEMREELAVAEVAPTHIGQVMKALAIVARDHRYDADGGWIHAKAILEGLHLALSDCRELTRKKEGNEHADGRGTASFVRDRS